MVEDYDNNRELNYPKYFDRNKDTFDDYLIKLNNLKTGIDLKPGLSATETFWLINRLYERVCVLFLPKY